MQVSETMALPVVSGREVIKALAKAGFQVVGRKGSHIRLKKKVNGVEGVESLNLLAKMYLLGGFQWL